MLVTSLLFLPLLSSAFSTPNYAPKAIRSALQVAVEPETDSDINLILNGNNIDLTPALSSYVEKRIGSPLRKLGSGGIVREVDVHLSVCKNPKVCCRWIYAGERMCVIHDGLVKIQPSKETASHEHRRHDG